MAPGRASDSARNGSTLDGELDGRAWSLGVSLGGGGTEQPAVALLREDLALRMVWKKQVVQLVGRRGAPGQV